MEDGTSEDAAETLPTSPRTWQFEPGGQARPSLGSMNASIPVPRGGLWLRRFLAFLGPGYIVSIGYMDPGNWATDLAGGSKFGYTLLLVILLSNLMAIILQALAARLGIVTGHDLAQAYCPQLAVQHTACPGRNHHGCGRLDGPDADAARLSLP